MEILIWYNFGALFFLTMFGLFVAGVGAGIAETVIKDRKKEKGEDPAFETRCNRIAVRVCTTIIAAAVVFAGWCINDNYEDRAVAKIRETVEASLAESIDTATRRSFDQRCQFNGHLVGADWIESDTFPCVDFGGIRLWKNSQIVVSKYNAGEDSKIFIGRPEGSDVVRLATYNLSGAHWGVDKWMNWELKTTEDNNSLESITASIRGGLASKAE